MFYVLMRRAQSRAGRFFTIDALNANWLVKWIEYYITSTLTCIGIVFAEVGQDVRTMT